MFNWTKFTLYSIEYKIKWNFYSLSLKYIWIDEKFVPFYGIFIWLNLNICLIQWNQCLIRSIYIWFNWIYVWYKRTLFNSIEYIYDMFVINDNRMNIWYNWIYVSFNGIFIWFNWMYVWFNGISVWLNWIYIWFNGIYLDLRQWLFLIQLNICLNQWCLYLIQLLNSMKPLFNSMECLFDSIESIFY